MEPTTPSTYGFCHGLAGADTADAAERVTTAIASGEAHVADPKGGPRRLVEEEVEVASYPLTTDARGRAELRVECPEPGRWRLRWRGRWTQPRFSPPRKPRRCGA